jgi:hypothetical protein
MGAPATQKAPMRQGVHAAAAAAVAAAEPNRPAGHADRTDGEYINTQTLTRRINTHVLETHSHTHKH